MALYGNTLYFADTGNDTVAVIRRRSSLNPDDYVEPHETLINVGVNPQGVAVSPDGSQVWVADTGPQTGEPTARRAQRDLRRHQHGDGDEKLLGDRPSPDRVLALRRHRLRDHVGFGVLRPTTPPPTGWSP